MMSAVKAPEFRHARTNKGRVAYQVAGNGPTDLLVVKPSFLPVDLLWEEPELASFLNRLSRFSRHISFDPRGTGSSDRLEGPETRLAESLVEDIVGVLDDLGCERAVVLGFVGPPALLFAASHPERTSGLVLINASARFRRAPDYPEGLDDEDVDTILSAGGTVTFRAVHFAPSKMNDEAFVSWLARCERLSATPEDAYWRLQQSYDADLRESLAAIHVHTLVMARQGSRLLDQGRYLADHIADARFVELPAGDPLFFVGDTRLMLDSIEEFVTGRRPQPDVDRVLATVLFTDIVSSTEHASRLGDRRWKELLATHDKVVRAELDRFGGRFVKSTGDGILATFDGPGRAIRCACAIRDSVGALGLDVRAGLHTGEVEIVVGDVAGIAVHFGARVASLAQGGEVLVSSIVKDLVAGSGIDFTPRGEHQLRGIAGTWSLYAVSG